MTEPLPADLPVIPLDATGLNCPEPVMMLHQAIRRAQPGQVVEVWATDPSTQRDIPKFCQHLGHRLLLQDHVEGRYHYQIAKRA